MPTLVNPVQVHVNLLFLLPAADQTRMMQDQMSGAAMAMSPDPSKAFKVTLLSLSAPFESKISHLIYSHFFTNILDFFNFLSNNR